MKHVENIGEKFCDPGLDSLLSYELEVQEKTKIHTLDFIKIITSCDSETTTQITKSPQNEKIFSNHIFKELVSRIYKGLLQFNNNYINDPI